MSWRMVEKLGGRNRNPLMCVRSIAACWPTLDYWAREKKNQVSLSLKLFFYPKIMCRPQGSCIIIGRKEILFSIEPRESLRLCCPVFNRNLFSEQRNILIHLGQNGQSGSLALSYLDSEGMFIQHTNPIFISFVGWPLKSLLMKFFKIRLMTEVITV